MTIYCWNLATSAKSSRATAPTEIGSSLARGTCGGPKQAPSLAVLAPNCQRATIMRAHKRHLRRALHPTLAMPQLKYRLGMPIVTTCPLGAKHISQLE